MRIHRRDDAQTLDIPLEEAWAFFSNPGNLASITPKEIGFVPLTGDGKPVYPGQVFTYKISPVAGIPMRWTTEISHVQEQVYFVDIQVSGPYAYWHHLHRFTSLNAKQTLVEDTLHYAVPGGRLGDLLAGWWVRKAIDQIFTHRHQQLEALFPPRP